MSLTSISAMSGHAGTRADHLVMAIHDLHQRLDRLADVRPRPDVDALFGSLVRLVVNAPEDATTAAALRDPRVRAISPALQTQCALGELALEREWARRITTHCHPAEELTRFPYHGNYAQLARMELGVLASAMRRPVSSAAFVGCGPLPLTALALTRELGARTRIVDRDASALNAALDVADALRAGRLDGHLADAASFDASGHEVVVLAAMAGASADEKRRIFEQLRRSMTPGAILLARSTRGLRTLLYPPVPEECLTGFDVLGIVHPVNDVINSVILARAQR